MSPDTSTSVSDAFMGQGSMYIVLQCMYIQYDYIGLNTLLCWSLHMPDLYTWSSVADKCVGALKVDWIIESGHNPSGCAVVGGKRAVKCKWRWDGETYRLQCKMYSQT